MAKTVADPHSPHKDPYRSVGPTDPPPGSHSELSCWRWTEQYVPLTPQPAQPTPNNCEAETTDLGLGSPLSSPTRVHSGLDRRVVASANLPLRTNPLDLLWLLAMVLAP